MTEQEFKDRTKQIALRVIRLVEALPNSMTAQIIGKQILRSAQIIALRVAENRRRIFYINWQLLKKKPTKVYIGLSY